MGVATKGFGQTARVWTRLLFALWASGRTLGSLSHTLRHDWVIFRSAWYLGALGSVLIGSFGFGFCLRFCGSCLSGTGSASTKFQGALLFGLLRQLMVRLVRARSCCYRLSSALQQMWGDRRVEWFPDASDDVSTLVSKAVPVASSMFHMLLGHDLHRRRRGPWLYVPFRTDFRHLAARGQTSGSLSHTFGYGRVVLGRSHAFGTSGNLRLQPLGLALALVFDTHNRGIMGIAGRGQDKTSRPKSVGEREGSLRASASHTPQGCADQFLGIVIAKNNVQIVK